MCPHENVLTQLQRGVSTCQRTCPADRHQGLAESPGAWNTALQSQGPLPPHLSLCRHFQIQNLALAVVVVLRCRGLACLPVCRGRGGARACVTAPSMDEQLVQWYG